MRIGVVSSIYMDRPLDQALDRISEAGLRTVEIGAAGNFPKVHCDAGALLADEGLYRRFAEVITRREFEVSALAIHGNPLHPDEAISGLWGKDYRDACRLAERLGVGRLTLMAGLPGAGPADKHPNWIVYPFPAAFTEALRWQWEERVLPYWTEAGRIATDHGLRLCFEMHPNDVVFNPATLLRLREAVGPVIGCNLDPAHLFWQGIDVIEAIWHLGPAIYHVHAKDTAMHEHISRVDGVLDPKPFAQGNQRSWLFRTLGYGHDLKFWKEFASTLRLVGYDDVISIEHVDALLSADEGFGRAIALLREVLMFEKTTKLWWD